jgi:tetratricopeptide (TPR) repeat protein
MPLVPPRLACALLAALLLAPEPGSAERTGAPQVWHIADDAFAKERASRLDRLFAELKAARSDEAAEPIVARIWQTWVQSGRPDIDRLMNQALVEMQLGNLDAALALLDEVVKAAPEFSEGWNRRATVLYLRGNHAQSLADCDRVIALEPRHFGALAGIGLNHIAAERWKPALEAYRRALAANPFLNERHELIPALERKVEGKPL